MIHIRKAESKDHDSIWQIIHQVIAGGDTFVFAPDSSRTEMLDFWCGQDKHCYCQTYVNNQSGIKYFSYS